MSIPGHSAESRFERWGWALRLSPVVVAAILAALWLAGAPVERPDLRFAAPVVARPGSSIGLRAWQMDRDDEGYVVVRSPDIVVELRDFERRSIAKTALSRSRVEGAEGTMIVPTDLRGNYTLVASTRIDEHEVAVERALYVHEGIDSRRKKGRVVNSFQVYELGPLRSSISSGAPSVLDARIEEGACVPDLPCSLLVWVGRWQGRVRLVSQTGVRTESPIVSATDGFARFSLLVRGAEGRVVVEALGPHGVPLVSRQVRIPLVPGGLVARASSHGDSVELDWTALGGRAPVLVDVFSDSRWVRALSLDPGEHDLGAFPPGIWRLQARADLFSDETAGVAFVAVGDSPDARLRAAADAILADAGHQGLDPLAMTIVDGEPVGDPERALAALFAIPAFDVVETGPGVSARVGTQGSRSAEQERRRWIAAGVILLLGLSVSMVLLRVEVLSDVWARRLLEGTGDGAAPRPGPSSGRGLWAFVLLVFVLMAVLALSKRWF